MLSGMSPAAASAGRSSRARTPSTSSARGTRSAASSRSGTWSATSPGDRVAGRGEHDFNLCRGKGILGCEATTPLDAMLDEVIAWVRDEMEAGALTSETRA